MNVTSEKSIAVVFFLVALFTAGDLLAQEDKCPAVNCDCESFAQQNWQQQCLNGQAIVKHMCAKNDGKPNKYCGLHGPKAFPVALQAAYGPVELMEGDAEALRNERRDIVTLLWSIRSDLDLAAERIENRHFGEAIQILTIVDHNIDSTFKIQRQLAASFEALGAADQAQGTWRSFASEVAKVSNLFEKFGNELWTKMEETERASDKKAYRVISSRVSRSAGELSEIEAYGLGESLQHKRAAARWRRAGQLSIKLIDREVATTNKQSRISYYRYQAATRLNRASYHWIASKDDFASLESHNQSQELIGERPLVMLIEDPEAEPGSEPTPSNDQGAQALESGHHSGVITVTKPEAADTPIRRIKK